MNHCLIFQLSGKLAGYGDDNFALKVINENAGEPLIVLTPYPDDESMLANTLAHVDGEDCWAGIYYHPQYNKFEVQLYADSNSPDYFTDNYFEALEHAKKVVGI